MRLSLLRVAAADAGDLTSPERDAFPLLSATLALLPAAAIASTIASLIALA